MPENKNNFAICVVFSPFFIRLLKIFIVTWKYLKILTHTHSFSHSLSYSLLSLPPSPLSISLPSAHFHCSFSSILCPSYFLSLHINSLFHLYHNIISSHLLHLCVVLMPSVFTLSAGVRSSISPSQNLALGVSVMTKPARFCPLHGIWNVLSVWLEFFTPLLNKKNILKKKKHKPDL